MNQGGREGRENNGGNHSKMVSKTSWIQTNKAKLNSTERFVQFEQFVRREIELFEKKHLFI